MPWAKRALSTSAGGRDVPPRRRGGRRDDGDPAQDFGDGPRIVTWFARALLRAARFVDAVADLVVVHGQQTMR
jgi:hypothetical protein